jgi:hypothetical protein
MNKTLVNKFLAGKMGKVLGLPVICIDVFDLFKFIDADPVDHCKTFVLAMEEK